MFSCRLGDTDKDKDTDSLVISKVQIHCAEWDRKSKCLIIGHQDSELGDLEICVTTKSSRADTGLTKIQLYRQLGDIEALLELEMPIIVKQGKLRESCLYLK